MRVVVIFSQILGEPWYGKDAGLVQGLATGPDDVQLAGRALLPVPRPIAVESDEVGPARLFQEPQRACRGQPEAQRVGPDDEGELPTLLVA